MTGEFAGTDRWLEEIVETVREWDGVRARPHRYGGTEFRLGPREIGHVHRWGAVDVAFTRRLRDALVAEGWVGTHHVYPDSGWTTFRLVTDGDVARALRVLDLSYCYHCVTLAGRVDGLPDVDVDEKLAALGSSPAVRAVFADIPATGCGHGGDGTDRVDRAGTA